ncbi:MAG: SMP-30/gluconolactonase/LRE family protein [Hyphomonadaceae bacterium]|nr:SMP-30/gluconolactonase/LRE family protein [Hyphomonadaceae bacterium]
MDIEIVAEGLAFPEGPVWMKDGSVVVVEIAAGRVTRIRPNGDKELVAECGGGPNGAAVGPDGCLYVVNNGGMSFSRQDGLLVTDGGASADSRPGWVDRIDPNSGRIERLYEEVDGRPLAGPNDLVFDRDGGMWFSDMGRHVGSSMENGGIYYAKADGSFVTRVVDGVRANGMGLSADGKKLYCALSFESLLVEFDIDGPGLLSPVAGFASGRPVGQFAPRQLPDSLAVDANGHVCCATVFNSAGITSVDPQSGRLTHHPFPDGMTTNICFGGADMRDAWVTLSSTGRLAKVRWDSPGLELAYYA